MDPKCIVTGPHKPLSECLKELAEPFPEGDIEWRLFETVDRNTVTARAAPYVTARAVLERLDSVFCGVWQNSLSEAREGNRSAGFISEIKFHLEGFGWISRQDAADFCGRREHLKGGASAAIKRAGMTLGIGRYLYGLPKQEVPILPDESGVMKEFDKSGERWVSWNPPLLPPDFLPKVDREARVKFLAEQNAQEPKSAQSTEAAVPAKGSEVAPSPAVTEKGDPSAPAAPAAKSLSKESHDGLLQLVNGDEATLLSYLKFKRLLPSDAKSLRDLPESSLKILRRLPPAEIKERISLLGQVRELIGDRDEKVKPIMIRLGILNVRCTHWMEASSENLREIVKSPRRLMEALAHAA